MQVHACAVLCVCVFARAGVAVQGKRPWLDDIYVKGCVRVGSPVVVCSGGVWVTRNHHTTTDSFPETGHVCISSLHDDLLWF